MADMINTAIAFTFSNFTLAFFVIGLIFSAIAMVGSTPITAAVVVEKLLAWYVFFTVGVSHLYNFIGHVFFGRETQHSLAGPTARSSSRSARQVWASRLWASLLLGEASIFVLPR